MGIKLANNAFGTLAAGIASDATSITLTTGHGDRFPFLGAGNYFYATLIDTSNNLEIVKCTARSTDVLTVTRAQEGTTARAYSAGDRVEIRLTAQTFLDASGDHVHPTDTSRAPIASPAFTGTPTAPTAALGTNTNQLATTAFVNAEIAADIANAVRSQIMITSNTTWTSPVTGTVYVSGCGGGGGGGGGYSGGIGGGGGGAGRSVVRQSITVAAGASYAVSIGAGGLAGSEPWFGGSGGSGGGGGNTTIGNLLTLEGGGGGGVGARSGGGVGGIGYPWGGSGSSSSGGMGASTIFGGIGGTSGGGVGGGVGGIGYGAGGGGGGGDGGNGAPGLIIIEFN